MENKKKYKVKVTKNYGDDGYIYKKEVFYKETIAISKKKAENNVRYNLIGKKYNLVDQQPNNSRFYELYEFEAIEM